MMPIYDKECTACKRVESDVYEPITAPVAACACGGQMVRAPWRSMKSANVISDECDVMIQHGICNDDGTPRHYTSKADMRREAERRGLENHVVHIGERGSDKSRFTSKWV